jgi:hypothetical protein
MIRNRTLLCALTVGFALGQAEYCLATPADQVVVLRHGGILLGQVRRDRDRLVVTQSTDHVIRVPLDTVDFVVDSLDIAYRKKLERIATTDLQAHFRLAQWCLRHGLHDQAADRMLYLSQQSPDHPWVRVLESRLRQQASGTENSSTPTAVAAAVPASSEPLAIEQFPAETMARFTRGVQPLLLNRCGQTTCHGSATPSDLQLLRGPHGVQTQVLTWQNLQSTLLQVNYDDPDASPLLQLARSLHGSAQRLPFEPYEQKQFQLLYDWVKAVAAGSAPPSEPSHETLAQPVAAAAPIAAQPAAAESADGAVDPFAPDPFNAQFARPSAAD